MAGILENVESRHRGVAEAVDEQRFELALEEVEGEEDAGEGLQVGGLGRRVGVDVGAGEVEERVDEEGAEVFDDEDGSPGDLEACGCVSWDVEGGFLGGGYGPRSLTWITLPSFRSRLLTVVFLSLGTRVPSSFVMRRRWMSKRDSAATRW